RAMILRQVDRNTRTGVANGHRVGWVQGQLGLVVASGEGLVDAVVEDLENEVVEPAGTGRADVHAPSQPDRLEPLENGDVLCRIGHFSHEKSPANSVLAGTPNSSKTSGRSRRSRGWPRSSLRPLCEGRRHESLGRVTPPFRCARRWALAAGDGLVRVGRRRSRAE